jgi:hypothetical protein
MAKELCLGSVFEVNRDNGNKIKKVVTNIKQPGYFFAAAISEYGTGEEKLHPSGTNSDNEFTGEIERWGLQRLIDAAWRSHSEAVRIGAPEIRKSDEEYFEKQAENSCRTID